MPGLSLLGPLVMIPGHASAPAMVSFGASKNSVMAWQAVSIVAYTTVTGLLVYGVLHGIGVF